MYFFLTYSSSFDHLFLNHNVYNFCFTFCLKRNSMQYYLWFHLLIKILFTNFFFQKMNPEGFINMANNMDKDKYAQFIQRRLQSMQSRNRNWKMSYNIVKTAQKKVVLQHKSNILLYVSILIFLRNQSTIQK